MYSQHKKAEMPQASASRGGVANSDANNNHNQRTMVQDRTLVWFCGQLIPVSELDAYREGM